MSRIYFHTLEDEAEVLGSERFQLGSILASYTHTKLREVQDEHIGRTHALLAGKTIRQHPRLLHSPCEYRSFFTSPASYSSHTLNWKEVPFSAWTTMMNTAHRSGSDDLILAAYIYSTCEAFGWVDGPDRSWFADQIQGALDSGSFRPGHGWDDVITLLRSTDKGEMVMSYSVTGGFPSPSFVWPEADWNDWEVVEKVEDDWEMLGTDGQWAAGMERLRKDGTLQITPAAWGRQYAGMNFAVQDLLADDWQDRLDKAVTGNFGKVDPWT